MRGLVGYCAAAALVAAATGAAGQPSAFIVNISATSGQATLFDPAPGWYTVQWIGTAQGGAYDGENTTCGGSDCTSGWTEAFAAYDVWAVDAIINHTNGNYDAYFVGDQTYSSAAAALSAFQTAGAIIDNSYPIVAGIPEDWPVLSTQSIAQPWTIDFDGLPIYLTPAENLTEEQNAQGGVSLLVTPILNPTAVPEPATWTLMLGGLGVVGALLRRRKTPGGIAAAQP